MERQPYAFPTELWDPLGASRELATCFLSLCLLIGSSTESGDTGRIDYDDKAISGLLDRDRSQQDEVQEDEDKMFANEYLASFKVRGETER